MTHETEHITDPHVFRLHVTSTERAVVFAWDYPGSTLLRVRIQRSSERFAEGPDQGAELDKRTEGQRIVYEGETGSFRDTDVVPGTTCFYTVWARPEDGGDWTLWARKEVRAGRVPRLRLALARLLGRA